MPDGIILKRIIDMDEAQQLSSSDYVLVDSQTGGNRKYKLGEDLNNLKDDLAHIASSAVPTTVRQAIKTLFETGGYADMGLTDEMAVISSWASQVTAIALNQSSISISGATTSQLVATTTPAGGAVTWASSNTSIATVSSTGLVTSTGYGSCTITASSGSVSASCAVAVSQVTLTSISAVYQQSGTVYDTASLDSLKSDLTVTATYSDSSTATVTEYTLSGTLTAGTSTITVSYGGKTATFNVTVTEASAVNVTYTQGSIPSENTDANRVSGVITNLLHFDTETLVITPETGYSVYPFGCYPSRNQEDAGTRHGNNVLYAYIVSDSGYLPSVPNDISGSLIANNKTIINQSGAGWQTGAVTYNFTKTAAYGYSFEGLGFLVKKDDNTDITPSEIEQVISIEYSGVQS